MHLYSLSKFPLTLRDGIDDWLGEMMAYIYLFVEIEKNSLMAAEFIYVHNSP